MPSLDREFSERQPAGYHELCGKAIVDETIVREMQMRDQRSERVGNE
jgi:hypothetical protein